MLTFYDRKQYFAVLQRACMKIHFLFKFNGFTIGANRLDNGNFILIELFSLLSADVLSLCFDPISFGKRQLSNEIKN